MSRVKLKNKPKLTLAYVLRRRKISLTQFVQDSGVQSYAGFSKLCLDMGIAPHTEEEYNREVKPKLVTSQQDGIVVLEPLPVIDDLTGRQIDPDAPVLKPGIEVITEKKDPAPAVVAEEEPPVNKKRSKRKSSKQKENEEQPNKSDQDKSVSDS